MARNRRDGTNTEGISKIPPEGRDLDPIRQRMAGSWNNIYVAAYRTSIIFFTSLNGLPPPSSGSTIRRQKYVPLGTVAIHRA